MALHLISPAEGFDLDEAYEERTPFVAVVCRTCRALTAVWLGGRKVQECAVCAEGVEVVSGEA